MNDALFRCMAVIAVGAGQLEMACTVPSEPDAVEVVEAAPGRLKQALEGVGSIAMAEYLLGAGLELSAAAYKGAAKAGSLDLVRCTAAASRRCVGWWSIIMRGGGM